MHTVTDNAWSGLEPPMKGSGGAKGGGKALNTRGVLSGVDLRRPRLSNLTLMFGVAAFWLGLLLKALPGSLFAHHATELRCAEPPPVVSLGHLSQLPSAASAEQDPAASAANACLR
jgi:hypothetical protein